MGNPFDFNRDGRWSLPERVLTHYGADPLMRGGRGDGGGRGGCGCLLVLLVVAAVLLLVLLVS